MSKIYRLFRRAVIAVVAVVSLVGCAADMEEYQQLQPQFDLATFFDGEVMAWGIVTDYRDQLTRRFTVRIEGSWQDGTGQLDEYFDYADGEQQFRRWNITDLGEGRYRGQADDIIGEASGVQVGPVLQWQYEMVIETEDDQWQVNFDDVMVLIDDKHLMNRAKIKKFGITVANVIIFFEKQ